MHEMAALSRVGPALAILRTLKGLSRADLAEKLGVSANVVGKREAEDYNPQFSKLAEHLDALGASPVEFALALERVNQVPAGPTEELLLALHRLGKEVSSGE